MNTDTSNAEQQERVRCSAWLDACKRRYEAAIKAHSKAQTADEENRLFDEVVAATDEYRTASASNKD